MDVKVLCFDGVKRLAHIRGKMRKKVWVGASDIILVGLRDYQDSKCDVILKYIADEAIIKSIWRNTRYRKIDGDQGGEGDGGDGDEDFAFDFEEI